MEARRAGKSRSKPRRKGLKAARRASSRPWRAPARRVEELYLLGRLTRALGSANIDHRLRQADFRDQAADPAAPGLGGLAIADIDQLDALLVVGSNLRREAPVLAHRVRKAAKRGAKIAFLNPARFDYLFPVAAYLESPPADSSAISRRSTRPASTAPRAPEHLAALVAGAQANDAHRAIAQRSSRVRSAPSGWARWRCAIRRTRICAPWPRASPPPRAPRSAYLAEGGNAAGAYLAGAVPHREPAASSARSRRQECARNARRSRRRPICCSVAPSPGPTSLGADALRSAAAARLRGRRHAVCRRHAEVRRARAAADRHVRRDLGHLRESRRPVAELRRRGEAAGRGAPRLEGAARARQSAGVADFDYQSSEEVREELRALCGGIAAALLPAAPHAAVEGQRRGRAASIDVPMYAGRCRPASRAVAAAHARRQARAPWRMAEARAHERSCSTTALPFWALPDCVRVHVLDPRASPCADPVGGVHHAVGAQGHRLDAAAQGAEPRRQHLRLPARHLSAVRRRHQAADQGSRDPRRVEQGPVPHRADDHADPGLRHLGGDPAAIRTW